MQEEFKILVQDVRKELFGVSSKWLSGTGIAGLNKLRDFVLKAVRYGESNISRDDLIDIVTGFQNQYKEYQEKSFSVYENNEKIRKETLVAFDSMTEELLNSFGKNENNKTAQHKPAQYVNPERIKSLKDISGSAFDLLKLIRLCEELNIAYKNEAFYSVGFLVRIIKDHIPPLFGKGTFSEVAANIGTKSTKKSLQNLENSLKHIADDMAHGHISKKEILPNEQTISFQADLDVLLAQIIKELSR